MKLLLLPLEGAARAVGQPLSLQVFRTCVAVALWCPCGHGGVQTESGLEDPRDPSQPSQSWDSGILGFVLLLGSAWLVIAGSISRCWEVCSGTVDAHRALAQEGSRREAQNY